MAGFAKVAGIDGESSDTDHKKWINIDSISNPISRSIPDGAVDQERGRGSTTLGDMVLSRPLDSSSIKLAESCANGTFYDEVEIHLTTQIKKKEKPFLIYKLKNVIITSYNISGNAAGSPQPSEMITMNFTGIDWEYHILDKNTGDDQGTVPGTYDPGTGQ